MAGRRRRQKAATERTESSTPSWFYWTMGVVALVGVALIIAAIRSVPDLGRSALVGDNAGPTTLDGGQFPTQFDSLGISIGSEDAPVVVREFADYQCPACATFSETAKKLRAEYVEPGLVRFVLFDFPITSQHPNALAAAQAARCAGDQGKYWEMHDQLFEHQAEWSGATDPGQHFTRYAETIGIDAADLRRCVQSGVKLEAIQQSFGFAQAFGVRSTPTVVVGDVRLPGVSGYSELRSLIEQRLEDERRRSENPSAREPE